MIYTWNYVVSKGFKKVGLTETVIGRLSIFFNLADIAKAKAEHSPATLSHSPKHLDDLLLQIAKSGIQGDAFPPVPRVQQGDTA